MNILCRSGINLMNCCNMEDYKKVEILKESALKIIEEQVDAPPEIMEVVDEHFFEML